MKTTFSKIVSFILVNLFVLTASAQYTTTFRATELVDKELSEKISTAVSTLLTEFNYAEGTKGVPDLSNLSLAPGIDQKIKKLWADCPFRCSEIEVIERAIKTPHNEYQVRSIPLVMAPIEGESKDISWKKYQEGVVTINKNGVITDFHLALDANLYIKVMNSARSVEDVVKRQLILEYVERFHNAYNLKDMDFLQQVFSEDALIITGKVIKTAKSDINRQNSANNIKIVYSQQNKKQYLTKLATVFKNNKRINILFDQIEVVMHPADANFYGVTLKQSWNSDNYSDEGFLFLLWDFTNEDAPQIHVRTWQPEEIIKTGDKVFSIDDFDF